MAQKTIQHSVANRPDPTLDPEGFVEWERENVRNTEVKSLAPQSNDDGISGRMGVYSFFSGLLNVSLNEELSGSANKLVNFAHEFCQNDQWPTIVEELIEYLNVHANDGLTEEQITQKKRLERRYGVETIDSALGRKTIAFNPLTNRRLLIYELDAKPGMSKDEFEQWRREYETTEQAKIERVNNAPSRHG